MIALQTFSLSKTLTIFYRNENKARNTSKMAIYLGVPEVELAILQDGAPI